MTTVDIQGWSRPGADRRFFTIMAGVVAVVVASGFGPSYAASLPPPGLPFWVHLHGAAMTAWILLFAVQAWLVSKRSLALHRRLGWLSIGLVVAMVPLGLATNLLAIKRGATPPFFTPAEMMAADFTDIFLFVGLYVAAILLRRQGAWHKRLMLCATVLLTWPALGRLIPLRGLGMANIIPASIGLLILLALVGPLFDLATRRKVHPAYFWGVGLIILAQPAHALIAASPLAQGLAHKLAS
ncbi:hypothetical protein [Caulobacter sp. FWC2]|uniref:hypothetical protein n=1 Tax=Caulobacter sp. FWC2 TaxID=69664 RepID=UPI000C14633C|nr:hypothetical protein [Caulobacter sp. FWC2]PIB90924.1 hypothetical protein CSW62_04680 [Caulobacter sp. FWC2]